MSVASIKEIVELTLAKVEILKLKADDYTWACHVDEATKSQLLSTLVEIDSLLEKSRIGTDTGSSNLANTAS